MCVFIYDFPFGRLREAWGRRGFCWLSEWEICLAKIFILLHLYDHAHTSFLSPTLTLDIFFYPIHLFVNGQQHSVHIKCVRILRMPSNIYIINCLSGFNFLLYFWDDGQKVNIQNDGTWWRPFFMCAIHTHTHGQAASASDCVRATECVYALICVVICMCVYIWRWFLVVFSWRVVMLLRIIS